VKKRIGSLRPLSLLTGCTKSLSAEPRLQQARLDQPKARTSSAGAVLGCCRIVPRH
jgi:hypothetical protein